MTYVVSTGPNGLSGQCFTAETVSEKTQLFNVM